MEKIGTEKLPFSKVDQVGVVVRDMDKAVEYYQALGIGPFEPLNVTSIDRKVYGKPAPDVKLKVRMAQMGQIQIELIQSMEGESFQKGFLESKGEGINHLGFFVDDIDKEEAKLVEKGLKVVSSGRFVGGGGFAYFDSDKVGGVIFELIQWPSK